MEEGHIQSDGFLVVPRKQSQIVINSPLGLPMWPVVHCVSPMGSHGTRHVGLRPEPRYLTSVLVGFGSEEDPLRLR